MGNSKHRLLTFADLLTLLLVVAVVVYFMTDGDRAKYRQVVVDLARVFRGGEAPVATGDVAPPVDEPPAPPPPVQSVEQPPGTSGQPPLAAAFEGEARFAVTEAERGLVVTLPVSAAFGSGSADLPPALLPLLEAVAQRLAPLPNHIRLEGFSDNVPIHTSEFRSNQELSEARAHRVRAFLEARGIPRERMEVVGYGSTHPAASNDTPEGRARNRRVDLVILQDISGAGK